MDSEQLEYLGFPTPEQQHVYDETQRRIDAKRNKFFGKSAVQPIDYSKLNDAGKAYRQNIAAEKVAVTPNVSRLDSILGKVAQYRKPGRRQILPFDEARQVIDAIYESDLASRERTPYWTAESVQIVDDVTRYFIGDPTGPIPLSKCLYIYGPVGVGKTYLFRMMQILCNVVPIQDMSFRMVSSKRLMRAISKAKSLLPLAQLERGNWVLDELGGEKRTARVYGEEEDVMDQLINSAYEAWVDNGQKMHFTSNKQPDDTEGIYGTRIYDRFTEMVESIYFPGQSIRQDPNQADDDE